MGQISGRTQSSSVPLIRRLQGSDAGTRQFLFPINTEWNQIDFADCAGLRGDKLQPEETARFRFSFAFYDEQDPAQVRERFLHQYGRTGPRRVAKSRIDAPIMIILNIQHIDIWYTRNIVTV